MAVNVTGPSFTVRRIVDREIEVVAQIGHVPVKGRAVGDDAEWRVMDGKLAADIFDDGTLARCIMDDVMRFRRKAPGLQHRIGNGDVADIRLHLGDGCEILQKIGADLPLGDRLAGIAGGVGHVAGRTGEVECAGRKAFLIQSVKQDGQSGAIGADACIFRLPGEAWLAVGRRAGAGEAARNHENVRIEIDPEFERAGMDDRAVSRRQPDAGTGLCGAAEQKCGSGKRRGEFAECTIVRPWRPSPENGSPSLNAKTEEFR